MVSSMNCNCGASQHCLGYRHLSSHNDWYVPLDLVGELHLLSLRSVLLTHVEDETVDSSGASAVILFSAWSTSLGVSVNLRLQLAMLFHPL